jgi:hypothetical protein
VLPIISQVIFDAIKCQSVVTKNELSEIKSYLLEDPSIECSSNEDEYLLVVHDSREERGKRGRVTIPVDIQQLYEQLE